MSDKDRTPWRKRFAVIAREWHWGNRATDDLAVARFACEVQEKALELMEADGKVEGKHYAAMKLIMAQRGIELELP
jgi:hypothetical protein